MKKYVAIALALVMVLAMTVVASAETKNPRYALGTYMQLQQQGSINNQVRGIQRVLAQKGYGLSVDGNFGSGTTTHVKGFQKNEGLTQDGKVGSGTWNALQKHLTYVWNDGFYNQYSVGGTTYFAHNTAGDWAVKDGSSWLSM